MARSFDVLSNATNFQDTGYAPSIYQEANDLPLLSSNDNRRFLGTT